MTTPVDIRPSPCPTQVQHGSACNILLLYFVLIQRLLPTDANVTQLFSRFPHFSTVPILYSVWPCTISVFLEFYLSVLMLPLFSIRDYFFGT